MKKKYSARLLLAVSITAILLLRCKPPAEENIMELSLLYYYATKPGAYSVIDNGDGTVYSAFQKSTWAKCSQMDTAGANQYNPLADDCSGGSPGLFEYCSAGDGSCDDGTTLNGTGSSGAWSACVNLTLAGLAWRVPTMEEMGNLTDLYIVDISLFAAGEYWSSTAQDATRGWSLNFISADLGGPTITNFTVNNKTLMFHVRCVSSGP